MRQQLRHISFLQTLGILLVVLGHSFYRFSPDFPVIRWIYGFHMPLFFFISGYLLRYGHPRPEAVRLWGRDGFLTRKARRLLTPYLLISSLVFVPKALMSGYAVRPVALTPHDYLDMLVYPYHNVLGAYWFLPTIFLVFACFLAAVRLPGAGRPGLGRWQAVAVLGVLHVVVPFHHDSPLNLLGVVHYMVYFALGYAFRHSQAEYVLARLSGWCLSGLTLGMSVWALQVGGSALTDLLVALNGILLCISLATLYGRYGCHLLDHLYGATFTIYLYSGLFQILALQLLLHYVALPAAAFVPLAFVMGVYGPWAVYRLGRRRGRRV